MRKRFRKAERACARLLSMRARQAHARANLWLWEMIAGSAPLFPGCYLQWRRQLERVSRNGRRLTSFPLAISSAAACTPWLQLRG